MAIYQKFQITVADFANGVHDMSADEFEVRLSVVTPSPTDTNITNVIPINYTNLTSDRVLSTDTTGQSGGIFTHLFNDKSLNVDGGNLEAFQFITVFNTQSTPTGAILCFYDFGSPLILASGESLTIDFTTATFTIGP